MSSIPKKLESFISDKNKSSHWKKYLHKNFEYKDPFNFSGFGSFEKKKFFSSILHRILAKICYKKNIFSTKTFDYFETLYNKNNIQINNDVIRHAFTSELLKDKIPEPKNICLIGDGKANGFLAIKANFKNSKIFSVNLPEILINDYFVLKQLELINDNEIQIIEDENNNMDNSKNIFFIPSINKNFLKNKNIDIFINIASFQEMTSNEVEKYMAIINNNKSYLYSANREYKRLIGNEEFYFEDHIKGNFKPIFNNDCSWHQKYYKLRFPFICNYDGNIKHTLVKFF